MLDWWRVGEEAGWRGGVEVGELEIFSLLSPLPIFNSFMRACVRMSFSDVGPSSGNLRGLFNRRRRKLNVN